ncbi:TrmH family RNA methyltransferase [Robertkochia flava]|uniref:TrmH family RNA methyltransferase n=1 Tax=Robertkochia flava TaxID=3447986 RepID=UPI001CCB12AD|nr:TrmH family RNA methyltransferase [Robertkochia marina]
MAEQLEHHQHNFKQRQFPITLVCDGVSSAANTGSLFRIADAFGVEEIIFCVYPPAFSRRMEKTARSAHLRVTNRFEPETSVVLKALKDEGYRLIALEITNTSTPLKELKIPEHQKTALIIGGENHGIAPEHLALADQHIHIEMFGINSSMNVAMATGICLYEMTRLLK